MRLPKGPLFLLGAFVFFAPQAARSQIQVLNSFEPGAAVSQYGAWQMIGTASMAPVTSCLLKHLTQAGDVTAPAILDGIWLDMAGLPAPSGANRFCLIDVCFSASSGAVSIELYGTLGMRAFAWTVGATDTLGIDMLAPSSIGTPVSIVIMMAAADPIAYDYLRYADIYYTATATQTPTYTVTPTSTISPTASASATPTHSRTYSPTFTVSPTASDSATLTPSATVTPTATISATASASASPTGSASPTPSATVSATPTPSVTASPSSSATCSPTITDTVPGTMTSSPTPTPTFTITQAPARGPVAYPNPLRLGGTGASGHDGLIVARLRDGDSLRIYTLDGRLVKSLEAGDLDNASKNPLVGLVGARGQNDLVWKWDAKNDLGEPVVTGLYLVAVKHEDASLDVVKVAVIR